MAKMSAEEASLLRLISAAEDAATIEVSWDERNDAADRTIRRLNKAVMKLHRARQRATLARWMAERARFERWATRRLSSVFVAPMNLTHPNGVDSDYADPVTDLAWHAWAEAVGVAIGQPPTPVDEAYPIHRSEIMNARRNRK